MYFMKKYRNKPKPCRMWITSQLKKSQKDKGTRMRKRTAIPSNGVKDKRNIELFIKYL